MRSDRLGMGSTANFHLGGIFMTATWNAVASLAIGVTLILSFASSASAQDAGAATYKAKCATCHGADGKGETTVGKTNKLRDLASADVQKETDADLTAAIASGKNKMPAYGKSLKPGQVKDLVTYIRSLAKK
jgi:cytochrome c6